MEENEYRQMYRAAIPQRCVFEKAVLLRHCACSQARHYNLAEREAVACESAAGREQCEHWLNLLRAKAVFVLQIRSASQAQPNPALPHAKEIRVQAGGLVGLCAVVDESGDGRWKSGAQVTDVYALLNVARKQFGSLERLPFDKIVRAVGCFKGRSIKNRAQKRPE